ncbi:putative quinol monooxygenase [Prauserella alba]|uniref:ABM domain-containing protein n=1 Tax=Prauserella alba TaxID=176898 RepID=A0ABN1V5V5_9PSEU|nr:putative quinol monooxygenase [Prauserella alba]MCP2180239.1 Quinol monooxygenase YgiN [Prauserella alba]
MTYANVSTFDAVPGKRDELVVHLTSSKPGLTAAGCLSYEVGVSEDQPDTVFVSELWTSAEAHRGSLELPEVREAIAAARPLISGRSGGFAFDVVGSPLRAGDR